MTVPNVQRATVFFDFDGVAAFLRFARKSPRFGIGISAP